MTNPSNPNTNITGNASITNTRGYIERAQQHGFDPSKMQAGGNIEQQFFGTLSQSQLRGMLSGMSSEAEIARKMVAMYKNSSDAIEKEMANQAERQLREIESIKSDLISSINTVIKNALISGSGVADKDKSHLMGQFNSVTEFTDAMKKGANDVIQTELVGRIKEIEAALTDIRAQKKIDSKFVPALDDLRDSKTKAVDLYNEIKTANIDDDTRAVLLSRAAAQAGGADTLINQFNPALTRDFSRKVDSIRAQSRLQAARKDSGMEIDREGLREWDEKLKEMRDQIFAATEGDGQGFISNDLKDEEFLKAQGDAANQVNNLIKYIEATLKENNKKQESSLNVLSSVLSTIGATAFLNKVFMSDPYTYGKRMGISTIGQFGGINSALSSAMGAQADHDQALNSQMFGVGAGLAAASLAGGGVLSKMGFASKLGVKGIATAGILAGGAIAAGGLSGFGSDMYNTIYGKIHGESKDQIFQKTLAQQLLSPERLASMAQVNQNASIAFGLSNIKDKRTSELGNYLDVNARGAYTGNYALDKVARYRLGGVAVKDTLNVSNEQYSQYLSSAGSMLNKRGDVLAGLTGFSMMTGGAYGVDPTNVMGMLATAQSFGSSNMRGQVQGAFAAAADKNGEVSTYAASVIAPAILRVTESLTIKNIASNGDKMSTNIQKLFMSLTSTKDQAFNKIMYNHPELMQQTLEGVDGMMKGAANDPNKANFLYRHGFTYRELKSGVGGTSNDPAGTLGKLAQAFITDYNISGKNFKDGKLSDANFVAASQYADMFNIDPMLYEKFLKSYIDNGGNMKNPEVQKNFKAIQDKANKNAESNLKKLSADDLNQTGRDITEANRMMGTTMMQFNSSVQDLQKRLQTYVSSKEFSDSAKNGISQLVGTITELITGKKPPAVPPTPGVPDPKAGGGGNPPAVPDPIKSTFANKLMESLGIKTDSPQAKALSSILGPHVLNKTADGIAGEAKKFIDANNSSTFISSSGKQNTMEFLKKAVANKDVAGVTRALSELSKDNKEVGTYLTSLGYDPKKNALNSANSVLKLNSSLTSVLGGRNNILDKTATAGASLYANENLATDRGQSFAERGFAITKPMQTEYNNSIRDFMLGKNGKSLDKTLTGRVGSDVLEKIKNFKPTDALNYINNEIKRFEKMGTAEGNLSASALIEIREQLAMATSMASTKEQKSEILNRANQIAYYASLNYGGKRIDPYQVQKGKDGKKYGAYGLKALTQEDIATNYGVPLKWSGGQLYGEENQIAGIAHGKEFIVGARNVPGNENTMMRINSGEKLDGRGSNVSTSMSGNETTVILTLSGLSDDDIVRKVQSSVENYIHANKLHYK